MATELGDDERRVPEDDRDVTQGLRLRALPAASDRAFPIEHEYIEIVYTPLVGPTAVLLARAMARHLDEAGGPTTIGADELALEVGIRASGADPLGKRSHLANALSRLVHNRIISRLGSGEIGVRTAIPPVGRSALAKLPAAAREAHNRMVPADWTT